jgi:polyribonucleotide nucleotidyltransferase
MFKIFRKEMDFNGQQLVLETGKVARQADGAVMASLGGTTVLCTVVGLKDTKPGQDFFPLSVHYQEKFYAAGRIPGSFHKREGRPSENETLVSRLIDRPIRPLFPEGFFNEVQVIATVLSHDMVNNPDVVAMIGCSAALTISGIPFMGPIGGCRIGYKDGQYLINPTIQDMEDSELDLVVAGTQEGVLMVESEAQQLPEDVMLKAVMTGWEAFQPVINLIIDLAEMAAKDPWDLPEKRAEIVTLDKNLEEYRAELAKAYAITAKAERKDAIKVIKTKALETYTNEEGNVSAQDVGSSFKHLEADVMRGNILKTGTRIDARDTKTVRPIVCEAPFLERTHGSALFTRGETQAICVSTLGTGQDEQIMDVLTGEYREKFMLHYNFPPFSVGEAGRMGSPGRREIGHGKLAWRALRPVLPNYEDFPYTLRVVSEITESNGSSSMATVCGGCLSLMDAGVPVKAPVAGIAMGLIKEGDDFAVLTDILGDEDHLGDMDFKVAGTAQGITALQMDIKITSINEAIMKQALAQAQEGRMHILGEMAKALPAVRDSLAATAPKITSFKIPTDKIREVIGTGGKVIREICEVSGAKVDIEDDGTIRVAAATQESADIAIKMIKGITSEPEVGVIYDGKVVKIAEYGAFVNFMPGKDGLLHISEIDTKRVKLVTDYLSEGQMVKVKLLGIDDRGKMKLSMKHINQETGAEEQPAEAAEDDAA